MTLEKTRSIQTQYTCSSVSVTMQNVEMPQGKLPDHNDKTEHAGRLIELNGYGCESRQEHQLP